VGAVCRLQVWHQLPQVEMVDKLPCDKTLDSFRQHRQVRYWSVRPRIADRTASQHLSGSRDHHRSRDHLVPHRPFPIGGPLEPSL